MCPEKRTMRRTCVFYGGVVQYGQENVRRRNTVTETVNMPQLAPRDRCTGCGACQALDCDNMLAGVRSTPSALAAAAGETAADVTPAQAALAAEVSAEVAAQAEVGDAPASEIAPAGAEAVGAPSSAAASPAAAEVLGNDSSAEAASDERPLPVSEGGAR